LESPLAQAYLQALLRADRRAASQLVLQAAGDGVPIRTLYLGVFQPSQYEIGRLWQIGEISVAQEHYCTAATQLVMSQLYPRLFTTERAGRTLVATCVAGDLHELGARMVADFFELAGWDTYFSGANTPSADVIRSVVERRADVLAISATLRRHVGAVATLIGAVRAVPACDSVRILVGGDPFKRDAELWRRIGADACGQDANDAVAQGEALVRAARARP
jgi:methanogenic corrinoid protein MtbC1